MEKFLKTKIGLLIALLFISYFAHAAVPNWRIIPDKSTLTFTATQNNAPVTGKFTDFNGTIQFDPDNMKDNKVEMTVNTNSIETSYKEMSDTLKKPSWFDVSVFPKAVFTATDFTQLGDGKYKANGNLTIRDKTVPVVLNFTLKKNGTGMVAEGSTTIKRTDFGVGQGSWASTDEIKDEVLVKFVLATTLK